MRRWLPGCAALLLLLAPGIARAHGGLKSAIPAKGAVLDTVPGEIRLAFSEAAELAFTRIELTGPDGAVTLSAVGFNDATKRTVVTGIIAPLKAGTYEVKWQVAGADGHPVRGSYTFSVNADAAGIVSRAMDTTTGASQVHHDTQTFPDAGGFNAESPLYVAIRWLQFSAILVLTGAVAFYLAVLGLVKRKRGPDSPMLEVAAGRAANIGLYASVALVAVAGTRLLAQSYAMHAPGAGFAPALMWSMIAQTTWGLGWILQVVAAVGAIAGFTLARRASANGWRLAAVSAAVGALSPALSGHAASAPALRTLAILADTIHIIAASGWLGSLFVLLVAGIPAAMQLKSDDRGLAVADLVNAFSPTALVFAGITASAGVFAAWLHLGNVSALWQTQYGKTLLVKLVVLGIVTATGAYNFLYVKPKLGTEESVNGIKRSATIEVSVALVVLLITAVLVATPTAMDMNAMTETN